MTKRRFAIIIAAVFLLTLTMVPLAPLQVLAQDDDLGDLFGDDGGSSGGDAPAAEVSGGSTPEPSVHSDEQMKPYKPLDDSKDPKDPFEPTIEPPMPSIAPQANIPKVEQRREIPPLPITVSFIVGSESNRLALLELNGTTYEMSDGQSEPGGLFKVLEVAETEVKIFDSRIQKNRVIKLTGGK